MYQTLVPAPIPAGIQIGLSSPQTQNSLSQTMLEELHRALDDAERHPEYRLFVIQGMDDYFCTGMDIDETAQEGARTPGTEQANPFFSLMRRFTRTPLLVVSKVDGRVSGGGVGLAAASDVVLATERSVFGLPEALWGLLPCCVLPFLIRRVGFQKAYTMTLTTQPVTAQQAAGFHLVDEVCEDPDSAIRRLSFRARKVSPTTMSDAKRYLTRLHEISDRTETEAVNELERLLDTPAVREGIRAFAERREMPWSQRR